jgi:5-methylcytosine-specific restriction protein A
MPFAARTPCRAAACAALAASHGFCEQHQNLRWKGSDQHRDTAYNRGYNRKWHQARVAYLRKHPLCVKCSTDAHPVLSTVVDHIVPHRGDRALFWNSANWQTLCKRCHDRKTGSGQ